ncbi:MAG: flagellar biosynthesis protein FlhA [Verrucomicrobia bacterium]|nr:flagellar biosynthesis protein FlhA [Verrucomicrobiota bacterium]
MAAANPTSGSRFKWSDLLKQTDLIFTLGLFGVILLLVLPVPTWLLDFLLSLNIGLSMMILLVIIYVKDPPEFSSFPTILLAVTLLRLALNIASTRLILLDGYAGHVIEAFGNVLIQGNYLVGAVVFIILVIINFVVITKGAGRIAEVAARFTLDAMPGKQMAIDAELNAGIIDEVTATSRRLKVQKEADFYGAMDGASKFVRGDAVAGILITMINILGGFAIGMLQKGLALDQALAKYTLLSIGDGLVSQVPALVISVAAGLLVTRTPGENNLGSQIGAQLSAYPRAVTIAAGLIAAMGLAPGMPIIPFFTLGGITGFLAYLLNKQTKDVDQKGLKGALALPAPSGGRAGGGGQNQGGSGQQGTENKGPEDFHRLIETEVLSIEVGYGLLRLADKTQGGELLDRITGVRKGFARDNGMVIPPIAIRDSLELEPNEYQFMLRGKAIATASLIPNRWLAMNVSGSHVTLKGVPTREPVFGIEAVWIAEEEKRTAEINGYSVVDAVSVLITHLAETLKNIAHHILSRQEVQSLIDRVKESNPALVAELLPDLVNLGILQRILQSLLREGVPIRNLPLILEAVADFAPVTKNPDELAEQVRRRLGTYFIAQYETEPGLLKAITIDPRLEQTLINRIQRSHFETTLALDAHSAQYLLRELTVRSNSMAEQGLSAIAIVSAELRLALKRFFEPSLPKLVVLSYQELPPQTEIQNMGIILPPQGDKTTPDTLHHAVS